MTKLQLVAKFYCLKEGDFDLQMSMRSQYAILFASRYTGLPRSPQSVSWSSLIRRVHGPKLLSCSWLQPGWEFVLMQHWMVFTETLHGRNVPLSKDYCKWHWSSSMIHVYPRIYIPTEMWLPKCNWKSYVVQGRICVSVDFCSAPRILSSYTDVHINMQ